ncbi:MAG: site-specific integrase, partial [Pseudomonadota bacterium]
MAEASAGALDLAERWAAQLSAVRGLAEGSVADYSRTILGFLGFMASHRGGPLGRAALGELSVSELRAWMAAERRRGVGARSLAREVSALRSFYRWLDEAEGISCPAIEILQSPKVPRHLPRPVSEAGARAVLTAVSADREPWIQARDQAALTLIWGAGLRISEALSLRQRDAPLGEVLRVRGKRGKERDVPVLPVSRDAVETYRALCPHAVGPDEPLFLGARGGAL